MVSVGKLAIEIRLLGPFEVVTGERVVEIGSPKQRLLLAMLVLNRNRVVSVDALAEELWGEQLPTSVPTSVQSLASRLRRLLVDAAGGEVRLRASGPGYVLELDASGIDACRFDDLAARGREATARGSPKGALPLFRQALALWRGPALADLADRDFARPEATRLDEARREVVEELAGAELAVGRPEAAHALLADHVAANPLRERAWGQLMVALYRLGRQAEALRAYQELRRILGEELGLEPTPALRHLEQQILVQSPELSGPTMVGFPVRPSGGTLAFLFTDIESSTRRWEGDEQAMAWDLARHDELLRDAVQNHEGRLFTHTGDGLGASFPTVRAALAAAVAGQRALLDQAWKAPAPLRVRMAIHVGSAEERDGTYLGPTLHRTARLLDLAAGGQVLCSQAAADLARDQLPPDVALVDLGDHLLADLTRPERIYQVQHSGLPSGFPPLPTPGSLRHNLPLALTSFVGREGELEELTRILPTTRLLTLTGVGGAGKTRLALELATRSRDRFDDGVWLAELASVRDPSLVALEVLAALGILTGGVGLGSTVPEERLTDYLSSRSLLLVLDNCEHVVEAVAGLVQGILSRCPDVLVLATSREVLSVPGEAPWPVPCLSLPSAGAAAPEDLAGSDAVSLFSSRACVAQPGFGITPANAGAIAQICRRLDGIPLALELAAARIRALGAQQLARHLDDRFRLLSGGGRTAVSRHQTLRAAMDWSFNLLSGPEQVLLRRLSVFPQSFTLEAAEEVGGEEAPADGFSTIDLLVRLVDKSLVSVTDDGENIRYHLLETVRQYGAEKLVDAGEAHETHRRHRDFFLALAERRAVFGWWGGPWVRLVDADRDNFQTALDWSLAEDEQQAAVVFCGALWFDWFFTDRLASGRERLQRALAGPATASASPRVTALVGLAWALMESGGTESARAEAPLREAVSLGERSGDRVAHGQAAFTLGQFLHLSGKDREAARQLFTTALEAYENLDPAVQHQLIDARVSPIAWGHHELGWIAMGTGQIDQAAAHFERGMEAARRASDEIALPHLAADLALVAAAAGQTDRAELLADEAINAARSGPFRGIVVMTLVRGAQAAVLVGRHARAMALLRESLGLLRELGARRWTTETLDAAALALEAEGQVEAAARVLAASDSLRPLLWAPATALAALADRVSVCRDRISRQLGFTAEPEPPGTDVDEVLIRALVELEPDGGVC